jgi:Lon protease-like protein
MFPLSSPLMPHTGVPLHVFEERYRIMVRTCIDDDRRFGVVLIERGAEVGGGDERADVGTLAEIADAEELPDGR